MVGGFQLVVSRERAGGGRGSEAPARAEVGLLKILVKGRLEIKLFSFMEVLFLLVILKQGLPAIMY